MRPLEKTDLVTIRLTDKEKRFLEERAVLLNTTMSDLLRKGAFADYYVYEPLGISDENMTFLATVSKIKNQPLNVAINYILDMNRKGFKKRAAAAPVADNNYA